MKVHFYDENLIILIPSVLHYNKEQNMFSFYSVLKILKTDKRFPSARCSASIKDMTRAFSKVPRGQTRPESHLLPTSDLTGLNNAFDTLCIRHQHCRSTY